MSCTKYYRTVFQIEVLSTNPDIKDFSLENIQYEITEGEASGITKVISHEEVTEDKMAELLIAQGSDPRFLIDQLELVEEAN